jgi:Flp pilus assembly protein TadD
MAYYNLTEYDRAIEDLNAVLEQDPSNAEAYFQRGMAHLSLNRQENADADMGRAVKLGLDPRSVRRLTDYRRKAPGTGPNPATE